MILDWPYLTIFMPEGGSTIINLWLYVVMPALDALCFVFSMVFFTTMIVFRSDIEAALFGTFSE
jgi:hypothetical protein